MDTNDLDTDHREAERRGLRFSVATKEAPGKRWMTRAEGQPGLRQAIERARALDGRHHEVAVFVEGSGGRYIYWTSREPDLLNSTAITMT